MTDYTRRDILATSGATLAALAGCTGEGSKDSTPSNGTDTADSSNLEDYAGLKPSEGHDGVNTEEGLDAWVNGIERDGITYTFNGGIRNEIDETMVEAEVEANLLYELPESETATYEQLTSVEEYFDSVNPGEEKTFSISVENHDPEEPTHWEIYTQYFLNE